MTNKPEAYQWSSCQVYYGGKDYFPGLCDTKFILSFFSDNEKRAVTELRLFSERETFDVCMEDIKGTALNETQARQVIEEVLGGKTASILMELPKAKRDAALHQLKLNEGLSIRQISRLTGLGFNIVKRA